MSDLLSPESRRRNHKQVYNRKFDSCYKLISSKKYEHLLDDMKLNQDSEISVSLFQLTNSTERTITIHLDSGITEIIKTKFNFKETKEICA